MRYKRSGDMEGRKDRMILPDILRNSRKEAEHGAIYSDGDELCRLSDES